MIWRLFIFAWQLKKFKILCQIKLNHRKLFKPIVWVSAILFFQLKSVCYWIIRTFVNGLACCLSGSKKNPFFRSVSFWICSLIISDMGLHKRSKGVSSNLSDLFHVITDLFYGNITLRLMPSLIQYVKDNYNCCLSGVLQLNKGRNVWKLCSKRVASRK